MILDRDMTNSALPRQALEQVHSIFHAAVQFRCVPWFLTPLALVPAPNTRKRGKARWSGVVQLTLAEYHRMAACPGAAHS